MGKSLVLVITPSPYLMKKIQKALDVMGGYQIITSSSPALGIEITRKSTVNTCILDVFHPEFPVHTVVKELRNNQPALRIILILSDPDSIQNYISQVDPDGLLSRSFSFNQFTAILGSLPEEVRIVYPSNSLQVQTKPAILSEQLTPLSALQSQNHFSQSPDFSNLQQRLTNLSAGQNAQAIILIRRKQLLSYKGKLPYTAVQEVVHEINSYSRTSPQNLKKEIIPGHISNSNGDVLRFIRLKSIQSNHLLYVISLTKELILAAVYDPGTQFSELRRQTKQIAQELKESTQVAPIEFRSTSPLLVEQAQNKSSLPAIRESVILTEPTSVSTNHPPVSNAELQHANTEIIEDLTLPGKEHSETDALELKNKPSEDGHGTKIGYHNSTELEDQFMGEPLEFNHHEKDEKIAGVDELNSPSLITSYKNYITYSCLLIPRMPQHLLTRNLAAYLFKWTGQLCLAFGWQLEHLSIHPNHIQMIAGAPLTTSPAFLVRTLRQKTSQHIFTQFPPLTTENPSGDFWAPGFFITGGKQTIQSHLVDRYVNEIRENQGVIH